MMHTGMSWFEDTTGIDLTPCHDADGTWNPGPDCTGIPMAPGVGSGSWPSCQPGELSGWAASCGAPYMSEGDGDAPTVSLTSPSAGARFESNPATGRAEVIVDIAADDGQGSGVASVALVIDGTPLAATDDNAPYQFAVNLEPGVYTLSAIATDHAGNEATSEQVDIGVDEDPPEPDAGDDGGGGGGGGGSAGDGDDDDDDDDGGGGGGSGVSPDQALPPGYGLDTATEGCACAAAEEPTPHARASWLLVVGVALVRRRARGARPGRAHKC
jgi:MYXO-CTERM domain-containing protein